MMASLMHATLTCWWGWGLYWTKTREVDKQGLHLQFKLGLLCLHFIADFGYLLLKLILTGGKLLLELVQVIGFINKFGYVLCEGFDFVLEWSGWMPFWIICLALSWIIFRRSCLRSVVVVAVILI